MNISPANAAAVFPSGYKNRKVSSSSGFAAALKAKTEESAAVTVPKLDMPSYDVTGDEAKYFREKYGNSYNEEKAAGLYYELADKGIISVNDAARSSGTSVAMPLTAFNSITYFGGGDPYGLRRELNRDIGFAGDRVYIKDVSRTDKDSPYKALWDSFKETRKSQINTWHDALQEAIDFERYIKENRNTADNVFQQHSSNVIEGLERTMEVIRRIFG